MKQCLILVAALIAAGEEAGADPIVPIGSLPNPLISATANDTTIDPDLIPLTLIDPDLGVYVIGGGSGVTFSSGDYSAGLSGTLVLDPVVTYGFTVTNFSGSPMTFGTTVLMPVILPPGVPTIVNASVGYTLTDGGSNGVTLTPAASLGDPDGDGQVEAQVASLDGVNLGVDVGLSGLGAAGTTSVVGPFVAGPSLGPAGVPGSILRIDLLFTLSAGDTATVSGRVEIVPVPEPSSVALAALGVGVPLVALALRRRRGLVRLRSAA